jgi:peptidyl-prolyl cis-trans isomerase SurA
MTFKYFPSLLFVLFLLNVSAQTTSEDVLFSVDDEPVYTSEFLRVYNKNLDLVQDESQKDVDSYLELFTNYKLKLKEARALGLHEKPSYLKELDTYIKQLSKSFLTDTKVTNTLVREAYQRISNEVKANHILVRVSENATPKDTLVAYNKILDLRNRTLTEGFEKVRKEVHNGQTVFGEELGYFAGFKMVYAFENAAFNTPVNAISDPFRTRFGYHFIKVFDKRKSRGERTVAHIMISNKQIDSTAGNPETRIQDIYKKIKQGEDFESLAKQFSDDKGSAVKGGMLSPFSGGQLSSQEFEDAAFGLINIGDISEPIQSKFGWHIIKLHEAKPVQSFEDLKSELEMKVKRDERSKLIDDALINKLRTKYKIGEEQPNLDYFVSILNDDYFKRGWKLPDNFDGDKPLIKIKDKQLTFQDFGDFLLQSQKNIRSKDVYSILVSKQYEAFLSNNLMQYQEDNLEIENEDFAHIVNEYRDGLLLFDLMETTIWNVVKTDSIGLQRFYSEHKNDYVFPERIDAIVASSANQKVLKKVHKFLDKQIAIDQIKNLVNNNGEVNIIFTSGIMDKEHQALPSNYTFEKGISKIYKHNNSFVLVQTKEVLPETLKTFEEDKGNIIGDYQVYKENSWLETLKNKYKIEVNQEVLRSVKTQIKKQ